MNNFLKMSFDDKGSFKVVFTPKKMTLDQQKCYLEKLRDRGSLDNIVPWDYDKDFIYKVLDKEEFFNDPIAFLAKHFRAPKE